MAPERHQPVREASQAGHFPATHWTQVLTAAQAGSPQAEAALSELCADYWYPLYAFVRRRGHPPPEAEDLTQEFFARLLQNQLLCGLKREGGRFRSFLLATLKCFLVNEWHRARAAKRGGGKVMVCADPESETRFQHETIDDTTPEGLFDRRWALTVLDRVLARLRDEHTAAGKASLFERLQAFLPGADCATPYQEVSATLQMNPPAVRMAVHRLRRRYGELLREEIAPTVATPEEVDEEIRHLIAVLSRN
jgi:RNA polymerase sigma-70 factor (ECF subfamily)